MTWGCERDTDEDGDGEEGVDIDNAVECSDLNAGCWRRRRRRHLLHALFLAVNLRSGFLKSDIHTIGYVQDQTSTSNDSETYRLQERDREIYVLIHGGGGLCYLLVCVYDGLWVYRWGLSFLISEMKLLGS